MKGSALLRRKATSRAIRSFLSLPVVVPMQTLPLPRTRLDQAGLPVALHFARRAGFHGAEPGLWTLAVSSGKQYEDLMKRADQRGFPTLALRDSEERNVAV